jgi:hypothetical protein
MFFESTSSRYHRVIPGQGLCKKGEISSPIFDFDLCLICERFSLCVSFKIFFVIGLRDPGLPDILGAVKIHFS